MREVKYLKVGLNYYTLAYPLTEQEQEINKAIEDAHLSKLSDYAQKKIEEAGFTPRQAIINFLQWRMRREAEVIDFSREPRLTIDDPAFTFIIDETGMIIDAFKN